MNIFDFSVKRPVTTIMLMFIFAVLGLISLLYLKTELIPSLTFPNLMVVTEYPGAGPLEVEKGLTRPLETAIRSVSGIKNAKSTSSEGVCVINAEFNWGENLDEATNQIRDRVGRIKNYLPVDAKDPVIIKMDTSGIPVLVMSIRSNPKYDLDVQMINKFCTDNMQPKLERTKGVASVYVIGGRDREIQVNCDKQKLYAYGISLSQVIGKIRLENLNVSAGNIADSADTEFLVRGEGEFKKPQEIENIIVGIKNGAPVYVKDVGKVNDAYADEIGKSKINGSRSISVIVMKETDANTVEVAANVRKALKVIEKEFPEGLGYTINFDTSTIISDSINALVRSALEGAVLAAIIIFLFLGRVNPTLIICISIPISLLIAFTSMYFTGYTINIMTLGGLVIALGRLVDDSVVVMENIFRRRQLGENAYTAAVEGAKEVAVPVISSTLVTVIVFLPIVFAEGMAVQLFKAFGATVFFALTGSLIVAFTIVPMLASKLFNKGIGTHDTDSNTLYERFKRAYGRSLNTALSNKGKVLLILAGVLVLTGIMFSRIGKEFIPSFVSGKYQAVVKLPKGSSLDATEKVVDRVEKELRATCGDNLESISMNVGTSAAARAFRGTASGSESAQVMISLKTGQKSIKDKDLYDALDRAGKENIGAQISMQAAGFSTGSSRPIEVKIYGEDLDLLKRIGADLTDKLKGISGIKSPSSSMEQGLPEFTLSFNRDKLTKYGLTVAQVGAEMTSAVDGGVASIFREAGTESNIRVRLTEKYRKSSKDLLEIPISSPLGFVVPLKDVVDFKNSEGPAQVDRENAKRLVSVTADYAGRDLSAVVADVQKVLDKISLPQGYFYEFGGAEKDRREAFVTLGLTFLMSILLIYMILASLYESFIHPFTVLLSVPFAITGALIALFMTGTPLGVTAVIGLIMLVGIVATNAIVLIDFVIKRRAVEKDKRKAIVEAAETRLRPILMTALATLFALLPIALGKEAGMELQIPMGISVVGGLLLSTFITLYIIPVVYDIFDSLSKKKEEPDATSEG